MSTLTAVRTATGLALASDALTTFDDLKLPPDLDAAGEKVLRVGDALVGVVGYAAHHLVLQDAFERAEFVDLTSRRGIFETFRGLHEVLKDEYYLKPETGEDGDPYESSQVSLLIAAPTGLFGVYDMREVHEYTRYWAMGSGAAFALGAMHARWHDAESGALDAGALAALGVETGCRFDASSGGPVTVYEVEG
ncbi:MFS transporter [Rubrivirga sp. IMCC43871]|uniref:MFS transporter n=1 Tax=Rubrivirga sp. IMCC43871 TaxID=3391575 RepID=UPI00398FA2DF